MKYPELQSQALRALNQLGKFWSFPRKKLVDQIKLHIDALQHDVGALYKEYCRLESSSKENLADLDRLSSKSIQQQSKIDDYEQQFIQFQKRVHEDAERIGRLETLISKQRINLQSNHQVIGQLQDATNKLKLSQVDLRKNLDDIELLHMTLQEKYDLVQGILALEAPPNLEIGQFRQLIDEDYMNFASCESSLANEAGALIDLQSIQKELELITAFPSIYNRTQIAIAGGFSAGKSQFINSFIKSNHVQLAVGMNPVTVVPSYVICSKEPAIRAYGANKGSKVLDLELYKSLSHEFIDSLGFDLRKIMPFATVEASMEEDLFEHLCLIDTPGYDPGGGKISVADRDVALNYAKQATAMIWVIGLGPNGTISRTDLEFIGETKLSGECLYILLNKADLKSDNDIGEIIIQVGDDLRGFGLDAAGICAYSSKKKKAHHYVGQKLEDFLIFHNQRYAALSRIEEKIDGVFDRYKNAFDEDLSRRKDRRKTFDDFKYEALQLGGSDLYRKISDKSKFIESDFSSGNLSSLIRDCEVLRNRFKVVASAALKGCSAGED